MPPISRLLPRAALAACALAVIALATDFVSPQGRNAGRLATEMLDGREVVSGEVLLRFRDQQRAALDVAQAELETDADQVEIVGRRGLRRLHSRRHATRALLAMLRANPDVEFVEPNYVIRVAATPNDTFFSLLWGLRNIGQTILGVPGLAGADIDATLAWDRVTGGPNVVVGVVDTGIDYTHPDLAANIWSAPSAFTVNIFGETINCAAGTHGFNAINNTCDPMDDHNHGTHVAGTIGAVGNNGVGVTGVNWMARLMGLKFLAPIPGGGSSGTVADAIKAIEFAVQAKAVVTGHQANVRVLNNSWGGAGDSQALKEEIDRAAANGMLFVAAAGNGGVDGVGDDNDSSPHFPSSFSSSNIIAVAATTNQDQRASFSNWGATSVHLGAPGLDIASTVRNNGYAYFSGTSMATPHVAGAAALMMTYCPWLTIDNLKAILLTAVDPIAALAGKTTTGGRLNINNAVRSCRVQTVTATPDLTSPRPLGTTITLTATATGGQPPYQYKWFRMYNSVITELTGYSASNTFAWTPTATGPYSIAVSVHGAALTDGAELSASVPYVITAPSPPPVSSLTLTPNVASPQPIGTTITWTATSGGGVAPHQYKWRVFDGVNWTIVKNWSTSNTFAWTPNFISPNYHVSVWVKSAGNPVDAADVAQEAAFAITDVWTPITWARVVDATAGVGSLTKTGVEGWNAGAGSTLAITSGDGSVEFKVAAADQAAALGLSRGDSSTEIGDIDYAILPLSGSFSVLERGVYRGTFGTYAAGDGFAIAIAGGVVWYRHNGVAFYASTVAPQYPLLVDAALFTPGAMLTDMKFVAPVASLATTGRRLGDFDGDGQTDLAIYRPSNGEWYTLQSGPGHTEYTTLALGGGPDVAVPGDYDGDRVADVAVYRPESFTWDILKSSTYSTSNLTKTWGADGDVPVPADYDGDGATDIAVWRAVNGEWRILTSASGFTTPFVLAWGTIGDVPVPGDYDGDGKADLAVYRRSSGQWFLLPSSMGYSYASSIVTSWGVSTDITVPGDFDGDGKSDLTVYRPSTGVWWILQSSTGYATYLMTTWGTAGDFPVMGDYDGDGKADLVVFRISTGAWWVLKSSTSYTTYVQFSWGFGAQFPALWRQ